MLKKKYCQSCGSPTEVLTAKFCGNCGNSFGSVTPSTPTTSVRPPQKPTIVVGDDEDLDPIVIPLDELDTINLGFEISKPQAPQKTKIGDIVGSKAAGDIEPFNRPKLKKTSKKAFLKEFQAEAGGGDKKIRASDDN